MKQKLPFGRWQVHKPRSTDPEWSLAPWRVIRGDRPKFVGWTRDYRTWEQAQAAADAGSQTGRWLCPHPAVDRRVRPETNEFRKTCQTCGASSAGVGMWAPLMAVFEPEQVKQR